jgi:hypothetical protein
MASEPQLAADHGGPRDDFIRNIVQGGDARTDFEVEGAYVMIVASRMTPMDKLFKISRDCLTVQ